MTIASILQTKGTDVVSITGDTSIADAITLLAERRIGAVPVVDKGRPIGVFSERDVIHCLAANGSAALHRPVSDGMTTPALTVTLDEPVLGALSLMTRRRIRHLPVMDGDQLAGFVSIGDLVKFRIDRIEAEARALRDYIQSA